MLVEFVVPNKTVKLGRVIDECVKRIVGRWGGCTVTYCQTGYWRNPKTGVTEVEPVCTLSVSVDQDIASWFDELAQYVCEHGDQDTVYYRTVPSGHRFVCV